jgi:putative endonuclease
MLKRSGYRILRRNFRSRRGEIDLIVFRRGTLAFVEVRSLTDPTLVSPEETVDRAKQRRIIRAARDYCAQNRLDREGVALRYDIVAVCFGDDGPDLRHFEDAFRERQIGF